MGHLSLTALGCEQNIKCSDVSCGGGRFHANSFTVHRWLYNGQCQDEKILPKLQIAARIADRVVRRDHTIIAYIFCFRHRIKYKR